MKRTILFSLIIIMLFSSFSLAAYNNQKLYQNRDLKYRESIDTQQTKNLPYYGEDAEIKHLPYYEYNLDKPHNLKNHFRKGKQEKVFDLSKDNFNILQIQ